MKLKEALKLKGRVEIPDCSRDELPQLFADLGYKVGAEIGVLRGEFTARLASAGLEVYGVDIWEPYEDFDRRTPDRIANQESHRKHAEKSLSLYDNVTLIKKMSMDAVNDFEDESLDFVYIDANHKLKYATEDIVEWSKKVRKGGIVAGHDYLTPDEYSKRLRKWYSNNIHVKYAVDAYVKAYKIDNWYIIGRKEPVEGEVRDRARSFFWIK